MCNSFNKKFLDEAANQLSHHNEEEDRSPTRFMTMAIDLAIKGVEANEGGPFGCVVVKDGKVIGVGNNQVTSKNDPTAHAEMLAIRQACDQLGSHQLEGCAIYTSCEPCPMCLGAIYWARPDKVFYACSHKDAAKSGFDDAFIYKEIDLDPQSRKINFEQIGENEARRAFEAWDSKEDKIRY